MSVTPSSEYGLLLDAMAPARTAPSRAPSWDGARWDRVLALAAWHRLQPMLYRHLDGPGRAPSRVIEALEDAYVSNAARNLFVGAGLKRILTALCDAEIPAMLLKGAALVESVYPDAALREMLDIDILVPIERLDGANAALAAIGYRRAAPAQDVKETQGWMRVHHHHDPALVDDARIAAVELHHHIAMAGEREHFDIAGLWERAGSGGAESGHLLPAPEDLLLHVCLHFTRSRLGGSYRLGGSGGALAQLADIAWIVAGVPLDWDALIAATRAYRLDHRIFLALFAAYELGVADTRPALRALCPPGFDPRLGRRLVALRVLRGSRGFPVRRLGWMLAPGHEVLTRGWDADPRDRRSLARAYLRRARAQVPAARAALKQPWTVVQDYRLNGQIESLEQARIRRASRVAAEPDAAGTRGETVR